MTPCGFVKPVESAAAAAAAVDDGQADLAVIRTDVAIPSHAQTVIILHRDVALLAAPGGSAIAPSPISRVTRSGSCIAARATRS